MDTENEKLGMRPLPGNIFVKMESMYKNTGPIVIPQTSRSEPHIVGKVVAVAMRPMDRQKMGMSIEVGMRVAVYPVFGTPIKDDVWKFPLVMKDGKRFGIVALIGDEVDLKPYSEEIPRCKFCGPAKSGTENNMLMWEGCCPRCGRDKTGQTVSDEVTVSDDEVEDFIETVNRAAS